MSRCQKRTANYFRSNSDNATRSRNWQRTVKCLLKGKDGYDEYNEECDAANPKKAPKKGGYSKKEMGEKLPLVNHGLVELYSFTLFFLTCIVVAGVASEELMKCCDITDPLKELHREMGGTETLSESTVDTDLAVIERHLAAEFPVSLRVQESNITGSEIDKLISGCSRSSFLIVLELTYRANLPHLGLSMKFQSGF